MLKLKSDSSVLYANGGVNVIPVTTEDWTTEYNALIISIKVFDSRQAAIDHINKHGTHHYELIISNKYTAGVQFQQ